MKTLSSLFLVSVTTVAIATLPSSNVALAGCGKKSAGMPMGEMGDAQGMGQSAGMPMCCKMKAKAKPKPEAQEGTSEPAMESMGEQENAKAKSEQKGQAAEKPNKEVKDPVCSMKVDPKTAEKSVYNGKTYYFCSKEDKEAFEKSPEKYVKQEKPGKKP